MFRIVMAVVEVIRQRRMKQALSDDLAKDRCVSCDSDDLRWVGPGSYRCNACWYEGGSGREAAREANRRREIETMTPTQRRHSGMQDLIEARRLLTAVLGTLAHTKGLSDVDLWGQSPERGADKQRELTSAFGEILVAQRHVRDAAVKLGHAVKTGELDIDFSSPAFALDAAFDTQFSDKAVNRAVARANKHASEMLEAVTSAIARVAAGSQ